MRSIAMNAHSQRGAILVVALIMLLLVTIIGIASMRDTSLQERMAGNLRDRELALQSAEAALRRGEARAVQRFEAGTVHNLINTPESISVNSFPGVAKNPGYTLTHLALLRNGTEAGVAIDDAGALMRIEASGFGQAQDAANSPSASNKLTSLFLVE